MLLLRQARKYGVSLLLATQSPGDIDYTGMGQVGTKILGRMTTAQEASKIAPLFNGDEAGDMLEHLPQMSKGNFFLTCPDEYAGPVRFRSRFLVTNHKTLSMEQIGELVSDDDRSFYR